MTAGRGMFQRGETFVNQLWPGTPLSRLAHFRMRSSPFATTRRAYLVTSKAPKLPARSSNLRECAARKHDDWNGCQGVRCGKRISRVVEHLDEGIASDGLSSCRRIAEGEADGDAHNEHQGDIEKNRTHDSSRECGRGVSRFF